jgi:glycosyltransferase involved in cell wall biosynthesis
MHILFVTGEYPPLHGGVGAYTAALGQALVAQGLQVSVLTSQAVGQEGRATGLPVYAEIPHWGWSIWRQIRQCAEQVEADWVHIQYQTAAFAMHPAINFAPWWWRCHHAPFRTAWTYHDLLVPYLFPKAGARLRRWVTEQPARASDLVIATNAGDYAQLQDKATRLVKIPIGSNIVSRQFSSAERQQRRAWRGYAAEDLVIGYFGFLNHSKGGLTLVQTLDQLVKAGQRAHLLMIGERVGASDPTNFTYLQAVETLITDCGLANRVHWTGQQSETEVSADLAACDLLLLPYADGASLRRGTLMAGLAQGCAIVTTTPQAPMPELVDGRDLLFVPPGDPSAAAQAILRLVGSPTQLAQLQQAAYVASQQFAWSTLANQHIGLYETDKLQQAT